MTSDDMAGPPGELDDAEEFAHLPPPRPPRSPLVALAVIILAGLVAFHLRDDVRYALGTRSPRTLGEASRLDPSSFTDNSFVSIDGLPDRRNALLFEPKGDTYRRAFFRLLGSGTRLLVHARPTVGELDAEYNDHFVGRLRRFDRIPFADSVRAYYATKMQTTRLFDLERLGRRLSGTASERLLDRAGEPIAIRASDEIFLDVDFPDDVQVLLSKKQFLVEEDARHELERLGTPVAFAEETRDGYRYIARVAAVRRDPYLAELDRRGFLFAARRERFHARFGDLVLAGSPPALTLPTRKGQPVLYAIDGARLVPTVMGTSTELGWAEVATVQLSAPIVIPPDAWLLSEGERPRDYLWVPILDVALALFALFNLWLLVGRRARHASTT